MRKVFVHAAVAGEIPRGTGKLISIDKEGEVVIHHTEDDSYFASIALCPHQNEPLDCARLEGCEVICRRHHLRFDLATGNCTNAGGYWLKTYEVRREGESILIGFWVD